MTEKVKLVNRIYEAFAQGDIPGVLSMLDPQIEWNEAEGFPYGGLYTGPDAVLENVFMKLGTEWEGFAAVPERMVSEGDMVVALGNYSGTFKATGKSIHVPFAHVWTFTGDKATQFAQHTDTAVVQRALG